jgi:osomolarity two-component system phosphorelay intermediate protein YPD1
MDDDKDGREFSRSVVFAFFEQAEQTFARMDDAL